MFEGIGGVSFKTGLVSASKPGFAQVEFPDLDGLVSDWLPVVMRKTLKDKECFTLDKGEQVACILDEYFENGVVLGSVYSDVDIPPTESPDKMCVQFFDGGSFEYDRSTGVLTIVTTGPVTLRAGGAVTLNAPSVTLNTSSVILNGDMQVNGNVHASGAIIDSGGNSNHHKH